MTSSLRFKKKKKDHSSCHGEDGQAQTWGELEGDENVKGEITKFNSGQVESLVPVKPMGQDAQEAI